MHGCVAKERIAYAFKAQYESGRAYVTQKIVAFELEVVGSSRPQIERTKTPGITHTHTNKGVTW